VYCICIVIVRVVHLYCICMCIVFIVIVFVCVLYLYCNCNCIAIVRVFYLYCNCIYCVQYVHFCFCNSACCVLSECDVLFCVLCLIVEPLPPGANTFAVKINNNNKTKSVFRFLDFRHIRPPPPPPTYLALDRKETNTHYTFK
jgi:hypothetical protein